MYIWRAGCFQIPTLTSGFRMMCLYLMLGDLYSGVCYVTRYTA